MKYAMSGFLAAVQLFSALHVVVESMKCAIAVFDMNIFRH